MLPIAKPIYPDELGEIVIELVENYSLHHHRTYDRTQKLSGSGSISSDLSVT
ncbi:hypothetical protein NUACC26_024910 [Scytonema sp. NUACC26]